MTTTPIDPQQWLSRDAVAKALTEEGLRTSPATLASRVTRGGSPAYRINNRVAEYQWGPTLAWRRSLLAYRGSTATDQQQPA